MIKNNWATIITIVLLLSSFGWLGYQKEQDELRIQEQKKRDKEAVLVLAELKRKEKIQKKMELERQERKKLLLREKKFYARLIENINIDGVKWVVENQDNINNYFSQKGYHLEHVNNFWNTYNEIGNFAKKIGNEGAKSAYFLLIKMTLSDLKSELSSIDYNGKWKKSNEENKIEISKSIFNNYKYKLKQLQLDPGNLTLKQQALEYGRSYYSDLRDGKLTLYDEAAISNDIMSVTK